MNVKKHGKLFGVLMVMVMVLAFFVAPAFTDDHDSVVPYPPGANSNAIGISIGMLETNLYVGDTINYYVTVDVPVANEPFINARQVDIDVYLDLPDGSTEYVGYIQYLDPGQSETLGPVPYVITAADLDASELVGYVVAEAYCTGTALTDPIRSSSARTDIATIVLEFAELGDFVWNDLNRDGIQDAGEPGIEDVTVNLWSADPDTCEPIEIIATTTTDADGYYLFDELRAGNYRVQFELPDGDWFFTEQFAGTDTAIDSNADPATGISDCVTMAAGDSDMTIDAGLYLLQESLDVSKTATGRFLRTHEWDITKEVTTEKGETIGAEEYPKIWLNQVDDEELATWEVCVSYVGYEDHGYNVFGTVTIFNDGELDAVITSVADVLGGTSIDVDFDVNFPYTLPVGQELVGFYDESGQFTGTNDVSVNTEKDTYTASAPIIYEDEPYEEYMDVVNVEDVSDLFDTMPLGTLYAPHGDCFTYDKLFKWVDYPVGSYTFNNTATIVETGQDASAILKVNVPEEELVVSKTAVTTFNRIHDWDIDKKVETDNGYVWNGDGESPKIWLYPDGSGDESALWTIDVTYLGYRDIDKNVSGTVTIQNIGTVDAVITGVADVLGGTAIPVDFGVTFPYTLPAGETLEGTYDEDGEFMGTNEATVTTQKDVYPASAPITWGDPVQESFKTVNIEDLSTEYGYKDLGSLTAKTGQFTYGDCFAWADYDAPGPYFIDNTATIMETGQSADARLVINWEEDEKCYGDETAWAYGGDYANANWDYVNNRFWGWTNGPLSEGSYEFELWAAAGQNDLSKGTHVGTVYVEYAGGCVTVTYETFKGYYLGEIHLWIGETPLPMVSRGRSGQVYTNAPGQFPYGGYYDFEGGKMKTSWTTRECGFEGEIYVAAHAVVWMEVECPE